jgi:hypothetical protein
MEFLNSSILLWSGLVVIPVVVHLLFRPKPKVQSFPAAVLLKSVRRRSQAILKLKHVILLLLRMAALLLIVLAVARPLLKTSVTAGGRREAGAVAIVIDDSYRMQYEEQGLSRFEQAKSLACSTLDALEVGSQITIVFASQEPSEFSIDVGGGKRCIQDARCSNLSVTCLEAVSKTVAKLDELKGVPRELYVFTDMTRAAWTPNSLFALPPTARGTVVYLVEVGTGENANAAIESLEVNPAVLRVNQTVRICGVLHNGDVPTEAILALFVEGEKRDEYVLRLGIDERQSFSFSYPAVGNVLQSGYVQISNADALKADNVRYFSLNLEKPTAVLAVNGAPSSEPERDELYFLTNALSPQTMGLRQVVEIEVITPQQLLGQELDDYKAVILANVYGVSNQAWGKLFRYVSAGGGLVVFGGTKLDEKNYGTSSGAATLLPANVVKTVTPSAGVRLTPSAPNHPIAKAFEGGRNGDLSQALFTNFLELQPVRIAKKTGESEKEQPANGKKDGAEGAESAPPKTEAGNSRTEMEDVGQVLMTFDRNLPALVQRDVGRGKVLMFASSCDADWSDFPKFPAYVPFVHELVKFVCRFETPKRDFLVGASVMIEVEPAAVDVRPAVYGPTGEKLTSPAVDPVTRAAFVRDTLVPGNYEVRYTVENRQRRSGWAVNLDCSEHGTALVQAATLEGQLPQMRVLLARDRAELEEHVRTVHSGKEYAQYVLAALLLLMVAELFFANRAF